MTQLIVRITDDSQLQAFLDAVGKMDFVEIYTKDTQKKEQDLETAAHDIFQSAGLWKDREIEATQLRKQAWKRSH